MRSPFSAILVGILATSTLAVTTTSPSSELPDFKATAALQDGPRSMTKADFLGHVWVANFVFTTCSEICPRMTRQMRRLQSRLPQEVRLVSFTLDPETDTVGDLQGYSRDHDADDKRWFFLRMPRKRLNELMKSGFNLTATDRATFEKNKNDPLSHNSRFVVIDARGRIRGYYNGLEEESLELVRLATQVLLQEK